MSYADIAMWQDMKKEPSNELVCTECHGLLTVVVRIISPEERYIAVADFEDAVIADGDSMGISAEVLKNSLSAIKWLLTIDDPLLAIELLP